MEHTPNTTLDNSASTQWHPAFFGSLQIEFENEADKLIQKEYALTLLKIYGKNKTNPLYRSVMETIVKNNRILFEEDNDMCQTLEDIMDKREAKIKNSVKAQLNGLNLKLVELGRIEDITLAAKDPEYQQHLLEEFGL